LLASSKVWKSHDVGTPYTRGITTFGLAHPPHPQQETRSGDGGEWGWLRCSEMCRGERSCCRKIAARGTGRGRRKRPNPSSSSTPAPTDGEGLGLRLMLIGRASRSPWPSSTDSADGF